jgi:hemoglobin
MLLSAALSLSARADRSLYADLGERAGIERIANAAVSLWLADDRVKDDFDNINLDRLKARLVDQLCQLAEGPCVYKGRSMAASHKGLHLTRAKFNAVAEDLQTAMEQAGIAYWTQNRLMARLAPMQRDIVTR